MQQKHPLHQGLTAVVVAKNRCGKGGDGGGNGVGSEYNYNDGGALSAEASLSCGTVLNNIYSCIRYVLDGGTLPPECCSELKSLISTAKTTDNRKSFCSCLKGFASGSTSEQVARLATLPRRCNAYVPFKINPDVDCSKVK
ncbi:hypothetical protein HAX54_006865 [Datura stramonium]|uniref:Non-specific lipid-transfer protein n=1 Tax=Datura stramonium TaxID=4076 RepID=A0ABS8TAT6_DATST|nr:hypothetical protein [Datura stramonium]